MDTMLFFEDFSRLNTFPCCWELNQHSVLVDASLFVLLDESKSTLHLSISIKRQSGINFSANSSRHKLQDLQAKENKKLVTGYQDLLVQISVWVNTSLEFILLNNKAAAIYLRWLGSGELGCLIKKMLVLGKHGSGQKQGRICCRICWREFLDALKVACICNHCCVLLELIQKRHGTWFIYFKSSKARKSKTTLEQFKWKPTFL